MNWAFPWVALVTMAGATAVAATPPSIPNGGFEQGTDTQPEAWAWVKPHESLRAEWTEGAAHQGKRAIKVRMPGERGPGIAWRLDCKTPVPVEAGQHYIASFWLKAACDRPVKLVIDGYHGQQTGQASHGGRLESMFVTAWYSGSVLATGRGSSEGSRCPRACRRCDWPSPASSGLIC